MRIVRSPIRVTSGLTVDEDLDFLTLYQSKRLASPASGESLRKGNKDITNAEVADAAAIALTKLASTPYTQAESNGLNHYSRKPGQKHRWTDEKLLKGAGSGADPDEIDVPAGYTLAAAMVGLLANELMIAPEATAALFQANPATGTFGYIPQALNDGSVSTPAYANGVDQYAEVDFGRAVAIKRYRQYGRDKNNGNGSWKIQYWNLATGAWADWVTGIATRAAESWSDFVTETLKYTNKIRLVATVMDTGNDRNNLYELEVIY